LVEAIERMKADGFESASMVETFPKNFQPVESRATARHKDSTEALSSLLYVSVAIHRARTGGIWDGSRFEYAERIGSEPIARCSRLDYALGMLFGPRGFIGYNPALYLSLIAVCMLIARDDEQLPEVIFAGCCICWDVDLVLAVIQQLLGGVLQFTGSCRCSRRATTSWRAF
jgi:hypothetical protein